MVLYCLKTDILIANVAKSSSFTVSKNIFQSVYFKMSVCDFYRQLFVTAAVLRHNKLFKIISLNKFNALGFYSSATLLN
jgi:hypothetical protein